MDTISITATTTGALKVPTVVASGSLMTTMVIFTDPFYWFLSVLGTIVSVTTLYYEVFNTSDSMEVVTKINKIPLVIETVRTALIGAIITPMIFMLLLHSGDELLSKYISVSVKGMVASFWFLTSLVMSIYLLPRIDSLMTLLTPKEYRVKRGASRKNRVLRARDKEEMTDA